MFHLTPSSPRKPPLSLSLSLSPSLALTNRPLYCRSVSIYGNKSGGFASQNAELLFAKDYNRFLYTDKATESPKRNFYKTQSNFNDTQHIEALKQNINSIQKLRANSPNYRRENPITHQGKSESVERHHIIKTPLSNVDNINLQTPDRDAQWKPCVR